MERELWPRLYHLIMEVGQDLRLIGVSFQPHIVLLVFFWAALHDRPMSWPAAGGTGARPPCGRLGCPVPRPSRGGCGAWTRRC